jgi:hypothetical protein
MHKLVMAVGPFRAPMVCVAVYTASLLPRMARKTSRGCDRIGSDCMAGAIVPIDGGFSGAGAIAD